MSAIESPAGAPLDDERLDLRHLPALPPMEPPKRFSQTLLSNAHNCKRSAYLYVKHHGGTPAHELDRGSAFHLFAARATTVMVVNGEPTIPPELAQTLLEEVLDEHPEFTVPLDQVDALREMAYHFAMGMTIDTDTIACIERKFLLELPGGYTLSGIVDLANIDGQGAIIDDYKTVFLPPAQTGNDGYEGSFQGKFYSALVMFGNPVTERPCPVCARGDGKFDAAHCDACDSRRKIVELDRCLGEHLTWVDVGERYPRYLDSAGDMLRRHYGMTRLEVQKVRDDLARMARHLDHAFRTGEWPAISGTHCARCPCEPECPLPRNLRSFAGAINTLEEAQEASEYYFRQNPRLQALRKEIKTWAGLHGAFRFGRDKEWRFEPVVRTMTDWPAMNAAIEDARQFGTPFNAEQYRKRQEGTSFAVKTVGRDDDEEAEE